MAENKNKCLAEALLYAAGDVLQISDIASALQTDEKEAKEALEALKGEYEERGRGIRIVKVGSGYQMCTAKEAYECLIRLVQIPKKYKLTEVQLETLSIIAYKQPVTRVEIENIRGVSCEHALSRLLDAGLIEEAGRLNTPGRPMQFKTTNEFLRRFGFESLNDLPDVDMEQADIFKKEAEEEVGFTLEEDAAKPADEENGQNVKGQISFNI